MFAGFKKFILQGNVIDLAVGVVIGAAFGALVKAFTDAFITPLIAAITGGGTTGGTFTINDQVFNYGLFGFQRGVMVASRSQLGLPA